MRRCKCLVRQQQYVLHLLPIFYGLTPPPISFRELCEDSSPVKALSYLQTEVSAVVDHSDEEETKTFRALLSHLLSPTPGLLQNPLTRKRSREEAETIPSEDVPMPDAREGPHPVASLQEDPQEKNLGGKRPPSAARFRARTEVFEELMTFVNVEAKQPDNDLVRLINVDSGYVY